MPSRQPSPSLAGSVRAAVGVSVFRSGYSLGRCIYCAGPCPGIYCTGHRDLPAVDPSLGLAEVLALTADLSEVSSATPA